MARAALDYLANVVYYVGVDLRQLRYFVVAAEEENMTRAAARLYVSQPALSQQVRELEDEIGGELFDRTARGLSLRPAGRVLLERARAILADVRAATDVTKQAARGEAGTLRVGFNIASGRHALLGRSLYQFRMRHPGVALELSEMNSAQQIEAFLRGAIDVGFLYQQGASDLLAYHELRSDRIVLAMSPFHPLATQETVDPESLRAERFVWLARSANHVTHDHLLRLLQARGLEPDIAQEARGLDSQLNMVAAGMGIALMLEVPGGMDGAGAVCIRRVKGLEDVLKYCVAKRSGDESPLVSNFLAIVLSERSSALSTAAAP